MQGLADHPKIQLMFYIYERTVTDTDAEVMRAAVNALRSVSAWVIQAPTFFDEIIPPANPAKDNATRRVGGILPLYSAFPPWGERLSKEIDAAQLREVENIILEMSALSSKTGRSIALVLDGTDVGWIKNGEPDRLLREGLLGPWRAAVNPHQ